MNRSTANGFIALVALATPLIAEYVTATPDNVPGTGFDVLLYKPFDFAYVLLITMTFVVMNIWISLKTEYDTKLQGTLLGIMFAVGWFVVCFLAVGQLHLSLGGKL